MSTSTVQGSRLPHGNLLAQNLGKALINEAGPDGAWKITQLIKQYMEPKTTEDALAEPATIQKSQVSRPDIQAILAESDYDSDDETLIRNDGDTLILDTPESVLELSANRKSGDASRKECYLVLKDDERNGRIASFGNSPEADESSDQIDSLIESSRNES